jgi:hypothetical protein
MTSSLKIKINFNNISLVSNGPEMDILEMNVANNISYFANGFSLNLENGTLTKKEVPP